MSPSTTYQYKPLSSGNFIRLLELKPAVSTSADLHCSLIESGPSSARDYEALSYVWGANEFPDTLYLLGGYLKITQSLATALKRFRFPRTSRVLWVDAVCINQYDNAEKGRQVAQMASIYKNAAGVLAWLGEDCDSKLKMEPILRLSQKAKEIGLEVPSNESSEVLRKWAYGNLERGDWMFGAPKVAENANFPMIYESPWFTRMWIVQEALLAKQLTLYLGCNALDWTDFQATMILLHSINKGIRLPIPSKNAFFKHAWSLAEVKHHWQHSSALSLDQAFEIAYYLRKLKQRDCKDDRDRIFALRGLLSQDSYLEIQVDYNKSISQVYVEFAREQLRLGHIWILYDAGICTRKFQRPPPTETDEALWSEYLPTWVPDHRKDATVVELDPRVRMGQYFGRDRVVSPNVDLSKEPYRLATHATLVDIITFIQPALFVYNVELRSNHIAMFQIVRQFCMDLKKSFDSRFVDKFYPTGEAATTAFAHALVGGGTDKEYAMTFLSGDTEEVPSPLNLWETYERCCIQETGDVYQAMAREAQMAGTRDSIRGVGIDFYSTVSIDGSKAWSYHHHLVGIFMRHCFFITADGYAGLAPLATQSMGCTDSVAFIDGANMPFVLRDLGEENEDWMIIGPCYVHGILNAEKAKENSRFSRGVIHLI